MRPYGGVRYSAALACALGMASMSHAAAVSQALTDETIFLEDQPVVLTPSRLRHPVQEAPAPVTVIDRRMIEASGFRDIVSVLRLVPGFQVTYARGNLPAATYHGLSSIYPRRMQVLVDGRSIYTTAYGQVLWQNLPLSVEDVERIEVVRGPNGAAHGINAFFATVNIITRAGGEDPGALAVVGAGTHSLREGTARYSGETGAGGYRVTVSRREDDRYAAAVDDVRQTFVNARADYRMSSTDELTLHGGYSEARHEEGNGVSPYDPFRTTKPTNYFAEAKWRRVFDADTELSMHVHHTVDDQHDVYRLRLPRLRPVLPPGGINVPFDQDYRLVRNGVEVSGTLRPASALRLAATGEFRYDSAQSRFYTGIDRKLDGRIYRLSGAAEYRISPAWMAHLGAMVEHNYFVGTKLSPRIAFNFLPHVGHSFRASVSRGYRSPTFLENYADVKWTFEGRLLNQEYKSPGNLRAESMTSYDLGYMFRTPRSDVALDLRVFYNRIDDIIELFTVRDAVAATELAGDGRYRQFANLYEARQRGLEMTARWQPSRTSWIVLNQTWTSTRANNPEYASSTPNSDTSLIASHGLGAGWTVSGAYYRQNGMTWIGTTGGGQIPAHDRLDARLVKSFSAGGQRIEAALVVQSAPGTHLEQTPGRYFDRRYFATLRFRH